MSGALESLRRHWRAIVESRPKPKKDTKNRVTITIMVVSPDSEIAVPVVEDPCMEQPNAKTMTHTAPLPSLYEVTYSPRVEVPPDFLRRYRMLVVDSDPSAR